MWDRLVRAAVGGKPFTLPAACTRRAMPLVTVAVRGHHHEQPSTHYAHVVTMPLVTMSLFTIAVGGKPTTLHESK